MPVIQEAEGGGLTNTWSQPGLQSQVPGQTKLHNKTVSKQIKTKMIFFFKEPMWWLSR